MKTHYIITYDWATEDDSAYEIEGVYDSLREALEIFQKRVQEEKEKGFPDFWEVVEDNEYCFECCDEGWFNTAHVILSVESVFN